MNLFEWTLKINGFPLKEARAKLKSIQAIPTPAYPAHLEGQKQELLQFHFKHNPCYRNLLGGSMPQDWSKVPIMTKADLQQPLADRLSDGYTKKNCYINKTSGSSGHPFVFAKDKFCHALTWARVMGLYKGLGIDMGRSLEARFYGIPLEFPGKQKELLKDSLSARVRFPIFDLSDAVLEGYLDRFKKRSFVSINGYTSSILLFAKYVHKKGVVLKEVCPSLSCVIVTSEMLFDMDRELMEQAFGVPIINEYGASELGVIAHSDESGLLVLNTETLYVEVVDDHGIPVTDGQEGRIVITGLYNKAHPMIRYEIGDIGVMGTTAEGRPALTQLLGRTNDVARLPNGKVIPGLTFYYVTKSIIEDGSDVREFTVEQLGPTHFKVVYAAGSMLSEAMKEKVIEALNRYVGNNLMIDFEHVRFIQRSKSGKLKQFISRI